MKNNFPFWMFAIAIMIGLTLPNLIQEGMFMDAMLYVSVAKNMANGFGTFWFPQFSFNNIANLHSFHEQPPLAFGLESLFFRVFGNGMYVERFYTFTMMCIAALLTVLIWKKIPGGEKYKSLGWLPLILWIIIPVCFWTYSNNMMENTMTVFVLLSVLFYLMHVEGKKAIHLLLSAICIFLASFTKGFPGFFTMAVPFIYWICTKKISFRKMMTDSLMLVFTSVLIYKVLFLLPSSGESLNIYVFKRALHRINDVPTVESHFYILYRLFLELLVPIGVSIITFFSLRKFRAENTPQKQMAAFFLFTGLAGSIPLILTMVQKGFYFSPSLPFFAIGFSILLAPRINQAIEKFSSSSYKKVIKIISVLLVACVLSFSFTMIGKTRCDRTILHDVRLIGALLPGNTVIGIPNSQWNDWGAQCYLIRYYTISVDPKTNHEYYMISKEVTENVPDQFTLVDLPTERYKLYKRKN